MKITITAEVDDEHVDADDDSGLTQEAYASLIDALIGEGLDDITITAGG